MKLNPDTSPGNAHVVSQETDVREVLAKVALGQVDALINLPKAEQNQLRRDKTEQALAESERLRKQLTSDMPLLLEAREEVLALLRRHGSLEEPALGVAPGQTACLLSGTTVVGRATIA